MKSLKRRVRSAKTDGAKSRQSQNQSRNQTPESSSSSKIRSLEIPMGKRTPLYRFFEILPGFLSYMMVLLLFILSAISPLLGSVYLLVIIAITLVKAVGTAVRTYQGYNLVKRAEKVDWHRRLEELKNPHEHFEKLRGAAGLSSRLQRMPADLALMELRQREEIDKRKGFGFMEHLENLRDMSVAPEDYPAVDSIYNAVIMVAYNEGMETLEPSVEAVAKSTFEKKKIIFVLGYEERGGDGIEHRAKLLQQKYKDTFYDFLIVKHPDGLPGEIKGKGPNLTFAGKHLEAYVRAQKIPLENVIVTSLDSDNRMSPKYLDYLAYEFIVHPERQHMSFQPVALFMNNIWDAPAPMRVIAVSNSFFNVINTMRPHMLRNFASHAQPLQALSEMDFWSKRTIVEDGHQYWRSLFFFEGNYEVLSIKVPIYQDAVISETFLGTLKDQFIQLRRWDYGASDVAYVGSRLVSPRERKMKLSTLLPKFVRLLDGHVTLAAMSPIVAFGGWVPQLLNSATREVASYNLPSIVGTVETVAVVGLFVTILLSLRMLPPRPAKYRAWRTPMMVLQWVLMPIIAIVYQSAAAFYSQTRLMLGLYMENFDVTKKVVKKN